VLGWAVAHAALSTCWSLAAGQSIDWDIRVLPQLLQGLNRMEVRGT
jgi:streptomycin 6-kinase